ncbi:peptidoglycan hydrolase-like protein with peptidoglycan-binding domain [Anaerobacterium chartisolvens]|uniref:Peptidoglycan hydrolase-like protein with peptidoglycan-binding domain n=1 Tax=Anaerobacterium chartisolvens TaxID=1297424 RepID=A0A369B6R2_9FIRM|nr:peptidoglycan-binding protein [Anaerobacterium chartisolvens]RCX17212.1 peptidoglycan hydrolase-like protein with peptidoglycan-binding domain [Anaerobacterium chartisolvens]
MRQHKKLFSIFVLVVFIMSALYIPASAAPSWPRLENGSNGLEVYALQYLLLSRGYAISIVDGRFGSGTESAVRSFQRDNGLTVDGIVYSETWPKLIVTVRKGSTGNAVKAVQYLLKHKYGYSIAVDGAFGSGTESTVKAFQRSCNSSEVSIDGIVGETSWRYLLR